MKVYEIYDEAGKFMTVTRNREAVKRKLVGQLGKGVKLQFFERTVPDDYVPKVVAKPAGCKGFRLETDADGRAYAVEEAA